MYELIITEKPSAAQKIAEALSDGKPIKRNIDSVPYYELTHNKKPIRVSCAVGHLFTVAENDDTKKGWTYPVFDLEWAQSSKVNKSASYTAGYVKALKQLSKEANEFTVATDYDIEGEVIGMNVVLFCCKQKDANRMKFSTLTKPDVVKAYEHKSKTLDWGQALAGRTRHELDWYFGINLSRALSLAVRAAGAFKVLSSGRVQGPALKMLVDKEREILAFKPEPFWEIELDGTCNANAINAMHKEDKFFDQAKADAVMKAVAGQKQGAVNSVNSNQFKQAPPFPFDLTSLQIECYRVHNIQPKHTLEIAQELYIGGYISYPRTSSQQLPPELGFRKLLTEIGKQDGYKAIAAKLLTKDDATLKPNNGPKKDEAHPAIFPTGNIPPKLDDRQFKLYDLIVRRFLATFSDPATRETMTVEIHVNKEPFITKGTRTVTKGWHEAYGPYATFEEVTLPKMAQGDLVVVKSIDMTQKETKPPKRYTAASVIKELEKNNLGTKSTRATIVDNLYDRGYVDDKSIQVTQLGMKTCETLEKYCPTILDVELTRQIEEEMEDIRQKKNTPEKVLDHARVVLTTVLAEFKLKEKDIGIELLSANRESQDIASFIGNGPDGNGYKLLKGKFGPFIGSVNYPTDTTTFKLPPGYFKPTNEVCEHCKFPTILKINRGKAPQKYCFNPACSAKKEIAAPTDKTGKVDGEGNVCPKCGTGTMVLRTSLYGQFLGCNAYPKCKNIMKIGQKYVAPAAGAAVSAPAKKAVVKKVTVKSAVKKK